MSLCGIVSPFIFERFCGKSTVCRRNNYYLPTFRCHFALEGRNKKLKSPITEDDRARCLRQDLNIEPQGPSTRILQIEPHHVVEPYSAPTIHLPQTSDAWLYF